MVYNEKLRLASLGLAKRITSVISLPTDEISPKGEEENVFLDEDRQRSQIYQMLRGNLDSIRGLDEYDIFASELTNDKQIFPQIDKTIQFGNYGYKLSIDSCITSFLTGFILRRKEGHGTLDVCSNEEFTEMESFFYQPNAVFLVTSLLYNFTSPVKEIRVGDFLIRHIGKRSSVGLLGYSVDYLFSPVTHEIEYKLIVKKEIRENGLISESQDLHVLKIFEKLITALRMLKSEEVGLGSLVTVPKVWGSSRYADIRKFPISRYIHPQFVLKEDDIAELEKLIRILELSEEFSQESLGSSLRRFNTSYERWGDDDRIVDIVVALEAILLSGNEQLELKYRFALRGVALMNLPSDEGKRVFENMGYAYEIRSHILHGERQQGVVKIMKKVSESNHEIQSLGKFAFLLRNYLRRVIRAYLSIRETKNDHDEVIAVLDRRIISGLAAEFKDS